MPSLITQSKFTSGLVSSKRLARSRYNKQKPAVLDSGKQQIQWTKSITSLRQETKRKKREGAPKNAFPNYGLAP